VPVTEDSGVEPDGGGLGDAGGDAGLNDAGVLDEGSVDSGAVDGGADAGVEARCATVRCTPGPRASKTPEPRAFPR